MGLVVILIIGGYIAFSIIALLDACIQRRIIKTRKRRGNKCSVLEQIHYIILCVIGIYLSRSMDKEQLTVNVVILVMWALYRLFVKIYVEKGGHLNFFMIPGCLILLIMDGEYIDYSNPEVLKDTEKFELKNDSKWSR